MDQLSNTSYTFEQWRLDVAERLLLKNDEKVALTPKAFDVLVYLVERKGHLVEKGELMNAIWPDSFVEEANLTRIIHTLRKTLADDDVKRFIETIPKKGYRFSAAELEHRPHVGRRYDEPRLQRTQFHRRIFAVGLVCFMVIAGVFLISFSRARSDNTPSFERMQILPLTQSGDVIGPRISPDGQYLVFFRKVESKSGLYLRHVATGQDRELLAPRANVHFWALSFSSNSDLVYFIKSEDGVSGELFRINLSGEEQRKLLDRDYRGLSVAPDGKSIAVVRNDKKSGKSSIIVADTDGANEREITQIGTDLLYQSLDWSPDSLSIVCPVRFLDKENKKSWYIAEIPVHGGTERRIGSVRNSWVINASWATDKKGLFVNAVDPRSKQPQIYYVSYPDGDEKRITNDLGYYLGLSITSDGKSLVTQQMVQDRYIWIASNNGEMRRLTVKRQQHYETVRWIDENSLIYDVDENSSFYGYNIWRMSLDGGEPQPLTVGQGNNRFPTVSHDGKSIAFVSNRTGKQQIWRMNVDGTDARQVTNWDYDTYSPQFSSDGEYIYFGTSVGGLGRVMRVSTASEKLENVLDIDIHDWAISPDGKRIAYSTFDSERNKVMTRVRLIGANTDELSFDIQPDTYLDWSNDGTSLLFTTQADHVKNIWRQSLTESAPSMHLEIGDQEVFSFSQAPNGKDIAVIQYKTAFDAIVFQFGQ